MAESDKIGRMRVALGRQLATWRRAAKESQCSLADQLPFSRSTVANVETGRQAAPRELWKRCDELLGAHGALLARYDQLAAAIDHEARAEAQQRTSGRWAITRTTARDGQRYANDGVQAVRLAVNGEARALGKLRDRRGTAKAVAQSYRLLERFPPAAGMTPCISLGVYSEARTAPNAATAYLAIADTKQVLFYTEYATQIVDKSPSRWSRALVRLDTATALLKAPNPGTRRCKSTRKRSNCRRPRHTYRIYPAAYPRTSGRTAAMAAPAVCRGLS